MRFLLSLRLLAMLPTCFATLGGRVTLWRTAFSASFMTPLCTKTVYGIRIPFHSTRAPHCSRSSRSNTGAGGQSQDGKPDKTLSSHRHPRKISLAPAITYRTFRPPFPKSRATLKPSDDSGHPESSVLFLKRSTLWTLVTSRQSDPINQLPRNWLRFVIFLFAPGALHGPSPPNATPDLPNEPISHLFSAQLSPNSSPAPPTRVSRRLSKTNPIPSFFSTTPHRTPALR